jgi:hypothetical protein
MSSVLTDAELGELLQLDVALVARLVEETDLPRVEIAGQRRFITAEVLGWLATQGALLAPDDVSDAEEAAEGLPPSPSTADTVILPAEEDEVPFVSRTALASLGSGASDTGQNLARQQVRDGLAALGDALHPTLVRLSHDRLHPAPTEADRTSRWRFEAGSEPIRQVTMAWGEGPPGFDERAHVALTVTSDAIEFTVRAPGGGGPPAAVVQRARASGALVAIEPEAWAVTYLYEVVRGAPTAAVLLARLGRDAKTLVPLWLTAADGVESA